MKRIRGEEQPGFLDILQTWLPHQPWFPQGIGRCTLTRTGGLRLPTPEGDADQRLFLELHIFDVEHAEGSARIAVPVALRSRPSALAGKTAFIGKLSTADAGEVWLYDGARDRAFLAAWLEMVRRQQGSRNGRSKGEAFGDFASWDPFTVKLRRTAGESKTRPVTRTVVAPEHAQEEASAEEKVVVEFIRRPTAERRESFDSVLTLTQARSRTVSRVLGIVSGAWENRALSGEGDCIAWEMGDLAIIRDGLTQSPNGWHLAKTALSQAEPFVEMAREMGRSLGTFHADLAGSFGSYPQSGDQLRGMAKNAQQALARQWQAVREEFDEDESADLSEVIDSIDQQLSDAEEPLMLQQIHGDLSLHHAHRPGEHGWVFHEEGGVVNHALPLRDVVTMLMSFATLVMEAASETPGADGGKRPVNYGRWYEEVSAAFIEGYRGSDVDSTSIDSVFFRAAMLAEALDLFGRWQGQWVFRPSMLMQVGA